MAPSSTNQATPSRLPSTRERRPALIALAIVLIVGGALASGWLALQSGDRAYFLQVSQDVAQGAEIQEDSLERVSLPEGFGDGIPADRQDDVVGSSAAVRLLPGTVLTEAMISDEGGLAANATQVAVPVAGSPYLSQLSAGDQLALTIGGDDGTRTSVLAELAEAPASGDDGGTFGTGDDAQLLVSVDLTCLAVVSQGVQDDSIVAARVGTVDETVVRRTCEG